ncbi:MAG: carboxypeptidase regulatory-like domain-containing protein [bacterium]|nr:carboxypeptidase regulatory-like domain-containing protein [bacterium]
MRSAIVNTLLCAGAVWLASVSLGDAVTAGVLAAGESPTAEVYVIRGQVVTRAGALESAEARLSQRPTADASQPKEETESLRAASGGDGRFEIAVDLTGIARDQRRWMLEISAPGLARRALEIPPYGYTARPGGVCELGGILLAPGAVVRGRATGDGAEPLAGVRVALWRAGDDGARPWTTTSGEDGVFEMVGVPHGDYAAVLDVDGYFPTGIEGLRVRPVVAGSETAPPATDLGAIRLRRPAILSGRVVDAEEQPLAGVAIEYHRKLPAAMSRDWLPSPGGESDSRGGFRLEVPPELDPGFFFRFRKEGYRLRLVEPDLEPGEGGKKLKAPVVLEATLTVAGRVSDPDGTPVADANVVLDPDEQTHVGTHVRTTATEGRFRFADVEPGRHRLEVTAQGFLLASAEAEVAATSHGREPGEVSITLEPAETRDLVLTVRDAEGRPVAGAEVDFHLQDIELSQYYASLSTVGEGTGVLDRVPVGGPYSLEVHHLEHPRWWRADLRVRPDQATIRVDLDPAPWKLVAVRGRVIGPGGEPVPGAEIGLVPPRSTLPEYGARADAAGRFELRRVKEGGYRLTAVSPGWAMTALPLVVDAGLEPVELVLDPGATLSGEIVGLRDEDLARLKIHAQRHHVFDFHEAVLDGDSYRFEGLGAGTWMVVAWAETRLEAEIEIEPGQTKARHDFELPRSYRVWGQVLIDGRTPARHTSVTLRTEGEGVTVQSYDGSSHDSGRFDFATVPAGNYELTVLGPLGSTRRTLSVDADIELPVELRTTRLRGRAVDAETGTGVGEAKVSAFPVVIRTHGEKFEAVSDLAGWFEIGPVLEGRWSLMAVASGYLDAHASVSVAAAAEPAVIELTPSSGLHFRVETSSGRLPYSVTLELRDAAGNRVAMDSIALDGVASGHWPGAPPGRFRLRAHDDFTWIETDAEVPGPEVLLPFPAAGSLRLHVGELALESDWGTSVPILVEAALEVPDDPAYAGPRTRRSRSIFLQGLTPGSWRIEVRAADGRTWSGTARVFDGRLSEAILALE